MPEATLADVLAARDKRVEHQQALLNKHGMPLICFTLNIAGPVKADVWADYAFRVGSSQLRSALASFRYEIIEEIEERSVAGFELQLAVKAKAEALKTICVGIEEGNRMGRLFDMDVIRPDGEKIPRTEERSCLVCGKPGRGCASRRLHSLQELRNETKRLINAHRIEAQSERIAEIAVQSLLDEVCTTPKPGLVDRMNNGSHRDMDIFAFNASASALWPYLQRCYLTGVESSALEGSLVFPKLQYLGLAAEESMLRATGGVNTHKGAVFTLGIMCAAAGRVCRENPGDTPADVTEWLNACAELARGSKPGGGKPTNGDRIRETFHLDGIRGEMAAGLPSVLEIGLPVLKQAKENGLSLNDSCEAVLLHLIAGVWDTNMIARGGMALAEEARNRVKLLLANSEKLLPEREKIEELDRFFIAYNLSPGGCADLLAAVLLADRWNRVLNQEKP